MDSKTIYERGESKTNKQIRFQRPDKFLRKDLLKFIKQNKTHKYTADYLLFFKNNKHIIQWISSVSKLIKMTAGRSSMNILRRIVFARIKSTPIIRSSIRYPTSWMISRLK